MKLTPMLVTISTFAVGCATGAPPDSDATASAVDVTGSALRHGGDTWQPGAADSLWHGWQGWQARQGWRGWQSWQGWQVTEPQPCSQLTAATREALLAAADRVADLQADQIGDNAGNGLDDIDPDDGGWDWTVPTTATEHSAEPSPQNTYGTTALGLWAAERAGLSGARLTTTLLEAGLGLQQRSDGVSNSDLLFLTLLSDAEDNAGFASLARQRYMAQRTAAGGARKLAELQRDGRHAGGQDGLIPYDLAWLALAADALDAAFPDAGFAADVTTYATMVRDDLTSETPLFDRNDDSEGYYTHGLAWTLVALSRGPGNLQLMAAVRAQLLALQHEDGSWGWNADNPESNVQGTTHVMTALALTAPSQLHARTAVRRAVGWLLGRQTEDGGWDSDADIENPQLDAEVMFGLHLAQCLPGSESLLWSTDVASSQVSLPSHEAPPTATPCTSPLR